MANQCDSYAASDISPGEAYCACAASFRSPVDKDGSAQNEIIGILAFRHKAVNRRRLGRLVASATGGQNGQLWEGHATERFAHERCVTVRKGARTFEIGSYDCGRVAVFGVAKILHKMAPPLKTKLHCPVGM